MCGTFYNWAELDGPIGRSILQRITSSSFCCTNYAQGILHNNEEIAVKKLTRKDLREVEREVSLVAQLQHENIVKFLGHCFRHDKMFLVYEYLSNGTLSRYFKCSADCQKLDWPKWLNIIRGIARGLSYLHRDSGKDIVHRDLKPSNVLLIPTSMQRLLTLILQDHTTGTKAMRALKREQAPMDT